MKFVVLEHDHETRHFDLMLERNDCLWTWSIYESSFPEQPEELELEKIQDHRKKYLEYEGPISGGRGRVERVESGTVELSRIREDRLEGEFFGSLWTFPFVLEKTTEYGPRNFKKWRLKAV